MVSLWRSRASGEWRRRRRAGARGGGGRRGALRPVVVAGCPATRTNATSRRAAPRTNATSMRCYAARYADLFAAFCNGDLEPCSAPKLRQHSRAEGRREGRATGCDGLPAAAEAMLRPRPLGASAPADDGRPPPSWTTFCVASPTGERRAPRMDAETFEAAVDAHFGTYGPGIARLVLNLTGAASGEECRPGPAPGQVRTRPMVPGLRFCGEDWPCAARRRWSASRASRRSRRSCASSRPSGSPATSWSWGPGAAARPLRRALDAAARAPPASTPSGASAATAARREAGAAATLRAAGASAVALHAGRFAETVPEFRATGRGVAVLRVDANFCGSYQDALYGLYDRVPVGGFVVFTHPEVMRCWLDFKADQGLPEDLVRVDLASAFFRKRADVVVDASKRRRPFERPGGFRT
ncbi:macrocin-O-methyltransferase [Aureococcus anophagefferens]|nr:macrocin-O-methyltransferase [Aureococcus anophagefferens]